jgi:hypothetical protein
MRYLALLAIAIVVTCVGFTDQALAISPEFGTFYARVVDRDHETMTLALETQDTVTVITPEHYLYSTSAGDSVMVEFFDPDTRQKVMYLSAPILETEWSDSVETIETGSITMMGRNRNLMMFTDIIIDRGTAYHKDARFRNIMIQNFFARDFLAGEKVILLQRRGIFSKDRLPTSRYELKHVPQNDSVASDGT